MPDKVVKRFRIVPFQVGEMLERRVLLSASAIVGPSASLTTTELSAPASNLDFVVTYSSGVAINTSTIDGSDIIVTGPNGFSQHATLESLNGGAGSINPPVFATYEVTAPDGVFNSADDGNYSVTLQANQVFDSSGTALAAKALGNVSVSIASNSSTGTTVPTATLVADTVRNAGQSNDTFQIVYSGAGLINPATLGNDDVTVSGANAFTGGATLISKSSSVPANTITATYSFNAPAGTFQSSDDGTYIVSIQGHSVLDMNGVAVRKGPLDDFLVNISSTGNPGGATLSNGLLTINGTASADTITVYVSNGELTVLLGVASQQFPIADVSSVEIFGQGGNDSIFVEASVPSTIVHGEAGADTIAADNSAADSLYGGANGDSISANGSTGNDVIHGGRGPDTIVGGAGQDTINGNAGNDSIQGGSGASDLLGGPGTNTVLGGSGNDTIVQ